MANFLLHRDASVLCVHGGQARATSPYPRVRVGGQPVVTQPVPFAVSNCPFTTPSGSPLPCASAQWVTAATRVFAGGAPVLLSNSKAVCTPNGTGVDIVRTQIRVSGS